VPLLILETVTAAIGAALCQGSAASSPSIECDSGTSLLARETQLKLQYTAPPKLQSGYLHTTCMKSMLCRPSLSHPHFSDDRYDCDLMCVAQTAQIDQASSSSALPARVSRRAADLSGSRVDGRLVGQVKHQRREGGSQLSLQALGVALLAHAAKHVEAPLRQQGSRRAPDAGRGARENRRPRAVERACCSGAAVELPARQLTSLLRVLCSPGDSSSRQQTVCNC